MLYELLAKTGFLAYIFVFLYFSSLYFFIERIIFIKKYRALLDTFIADLNIKLKNIGHRNLNADYIKNILQSEQNKLTRGLRYLQLVVRAAPMFGLLGTIIGLIKAFKQMSESGGNDFIGLASSLWEAILTTGFGLVIALIVMLFVYLIENLVIKIINKIESSIYDGMYK